jgi:hypothetical protein
MYHLNVQVTNCSETMPEVLCWTPDGAGFIINGLVRLEVLFFAQPVRKVVVLTHVL